MLRSNSGKAAELSASGWMKLLAVENKSQLWAPEEIALDFVVLNETTDPLCKTTDYYAPSFMRCLLLGDPRLVVGRCEYMEPTLSLKDTEGVIFADVVIFHD